MRKSVFAAVAATALLPLQFAAATVEDVEIRTAGDLVNICAIADEDPMVDGARGFCYGFLSGAANYHHSLNAGKKGKPLFCPPEPRVSRAQAAKLFVAWGRANPQYMDEAPVDGLMRFATETWACKPLPR